jgi:hypothetical protein
LDLYKARDQIITAVYAACWVCDVVIREH